MNDLSVPDTLPTPERLANKFHTQTVTRSQVKTRKAQGWTIDGVLPEAKLTILYGTPGSKKSFIVLDWISCRAAGINWQGRATTPAKVLYACGEGVGGLGARLAGWDDENGIRPGSEEAKRLDENFVIYPEALNLTDPVNSEAFGTFVEDSGVELVVFDTMRRYSAGSDENSTTELGMFFDAVGSWGVEGMIVHHASKTGGYRGSSAIEGDCDVMLSVHKDGPLGAKVKAVKFKDTEAPIEDLNITFKQRTVMVGESLDDQTTTLVTSEAKRAGDDKYVKDVQQQQQRHEHNSIIAGIVQDKAPDSKADLEQLAKEAFGVGLNKTKHFVDQAIEDGVIELVSGDHPLTKRPVLVSAPPATSIGRLAQDY